MSSTSAKTTSCEHLHQMLTEQKKHLESLQKELQTMKKDRQRYYWGTMYMNAHLGNDPIALKTLTESPEYIAWFKEAAKGT